MYIKLTLLIINSIKKNFLNNRHIKPNMAEKKGGKDLKDQIMGAVTSNVIPYLKEGVKGIVKKAQDAIYHTEKKIMENLLMAAILIIGFIFILVGVVYFINDYFALDSYWGFLIMGLILMIIAYFFRKHIEKTKYYKV